MKKVMKSEDYIKWKYKEGVDIETINTFEKMFDKIRTDIENSFYETLRSVFGHPATCVPYYKYKNLSLNEKERLINSRDAVVNAYKLLLRDGEVFFTEDFCKDVKSFMFHIKDESIETEDKK